MNKVASIRTNDIVHNLSDSALQGLAETVFWDQLSDTDIAAQFKMSKPTFYKLKRTSRFQEALKAFGEIAVREANAKIQAASDKAVNTLIDLLDSDSSTVRLKAAIETIRLSGIGQPLPEFTPLENQISDKHLLIKYLSSINPDAGKKTSPA